MSSLLHISKSEILCVKNIVSRVALYEQRLDDLKSTSLKCVNALVKLQLPGFLERSGLRDRCSVILTDRQARGCQATKIKPKLIQNRKQYQVIYGVIASFDCNLNT